MRPLQRAALSFGAIGAGALCYGAIEGSAETRGMAAGLCLVVSLQTLFWMGEALVESLASHIKKEEIRNDRNLLT